MTETKLEDAQRLAEIRERLKAVGNGIPCKDVYNAAQMLFQENVLEDMDYLLSLLDTARPTCEYCEQGSKPWQKNGVWLHEGGVACSTARPTEQGDYVAQLKAIRQKMFPAVDPDIAHLRKLLADARSERDAAYANGVRQGAIDQREADAQKCEALVTFTENHEEPGKCGWCEGLEAAAAAIRQGAEAERKNAVGPPVYRVGLQMGDD